MSKILATLGAVGFALWGALHIVAAQQVFDLGSTLEPGSLQGRILQDASYLLAFAVVTMLLAVGWVWRNDPRATWITIAIAAIADVPFVMFLVAPGFVGPPVSLVGPGLWLASSLCCLVALTLAPSPRASVRTTPS